MGEVYAGISISARARNLRLSNRRGLAIELADENDEKLGVLMIGYAGIAWKAKGKHASTTRTVRYSELQAALGPKTKSP